MGAVVLHRLRRRPWRLATALPLALWRAACPAGSSRAHAVNRRLVSLALAGMTAGEYRRLTTTIARQLADDPTNVWPQALIEARTAIAAGHTVVVVTATETGLAGAYLAAIGLPALQLFASTLVFTGRRPRLSEHNVGDRKVAALVDAGIDLGAATFFTDSVSDLPLARHAHQTIVVNPSPRQARTFVAELTRVQVVHWPRRQP